MINIFLCFFCFSSDMDYFLTNEKGVFFGSTIFQSREQFLHLVTKEFFSKFISAVNVLLNIREKELTFLESSDKYL